MGAGMEGVLEIRWKVDWSLGLAQPRVMLGFVVFQWHRKSWGTTELKEYENHGKKRTGMETGNQCD